MHDEAKQKADAVRAQIGAVDPCLLEVLDECKRVFGARLNAIDCGPVQRGDARNYDFGVRLPPSPRPYEEAYAEWQEACRAQQTRAGAYKGAGFKRATRAR